MSVVDQTNQFEKVKKNPDPSYRTETIHVKLTQVNMGSTFKVFGNHSDICENNFILHSSRQAFKILIFVDVLGLCTPSFIMSNFGPSLLFTQKDRYVRLMPSVYSQINLYCRSRVKEVKVIPWSWSADAVQCGRSKTLCKF